MVRCGRSSLRPRAAGPGMIRRGVPRPPRRMLCASKADQPLPLLAQAAEQRGAREAERRRERALDVGACVLAGRVPTAAAPPGAARDGVAGD
jgi:hypothetical protein